MATTPLSGDSAIADWLADSAGHAILTDMLAQGGQSPDVFKPVKRLAIKRLIKLSRGSFTQEMLDELIRRATAGEVPVGVTPTPVESATETGDAPAVPLREWTERLDQGRFTGQTVIVTGAGSGIGRATASRIVREGGRVVAVDVSQERLDEFAAEHPGADITVVVADITDDAGITRILDAAGGTIDGLANIAGIMDDMTPIGEVSDAVWNRVIAINVTGTMKLIRAVIPTMLAQGGGSIVNTASEAALRGSAAGAAYTASKHAVVGLTKSTAFMYGPSGIRCNAVAPGATITNIEATFASPLGAERVRNAMAILPDPVEADALAASITFLLSDDGVNVNGVTLASDGGWSAA
ncbi:MULTISPECIES: SDR family NAD(P)-dependent oxidoreductase [unclassified Microbacterium]|uniref:SDR family NAD(P)-dependent oxidoreductase n=1 Tax=unclassified Microbacterium TaxID=2609290 RepID=UPI00214BD4FE|nr:MULTISPECIES: SDR family NAD(P)-dependent oxidoreductase [unclassified Microbacterium]MCR2783449.1 SDR family oxidoreductase [Microbacterium sp. zg.B96]WIM15685.1 SDR family oxidoreductase [Microbacterium sp. zg-B96]